ncbi:MAG: heme exporter protein CcmB [Deltaproteobacteria bacterium]|nr:heme exporter protein CcmB [Deltaproteobacteria bacterium]
MLSEIWTIFIKDLRLDLRRMENFFSMFFFSVIILLVFAFAMPADKDSHIIFAPGTFWVTFLLSGILSLNKSFQLEKENACMESLLISPISRGSIFLGKLFGNIIFIMIIQCLIIPLFSLFFYSGFLDHFFSLMLLSVISAVGFSSLGTLLSGLTTDLRFKEILLPILLFPLLIPLLLASVRIMQGILIGEGFSGELDWLKLLIGFDLIFLIISYLIFDFVAEM